MRRLVGVLSGKGLWLRWPFPGTQETPPMKRPAALLGFLALVAGCRSELPDDRPVRARALVRQWAEKLDGQVTDRGLFAHHEGPTEADPWVRPLHVFYSLRGAVETV